MTNTTRNVSSQHQHNFNAQGLCGCGLTHDAYRQQQSAANAPPRPRIPIAMIPRSRILTAREQR